MTYAIVEPLWPFLEAWMWGRGSRAPIADIKFAAPQRINPESQRFKPRSKKINDLVNPG